MCRFSCRCSGAFAVHSAAQIFASQIDLYNNNNDDYQLENQLGKFEVVYQNQASVARCNLEKMAKNDLNDQIECFEFESNSIYT